MKKLLKVHCSKFVMYGLGDSTADGNEHVDLVVLAYRISVFHFIGVTPSLAVCWAQIRMPVDVIYGIP
ncbi:hypothetical protein T01_13857 [Trichinella spiralis]|uniref:Uncharacterized protein n=1 Tax=Trichinella spiralis TaxID=6334 RepID=A0A0V1B5L6_TRISP|nr:hypothetical protein T01_13857 [Trichinella spiralis]